ncbi:MAG: InlB B-repeat-containing protein [Erysipelotrichia bacterium]|nr:InlB B-repeat-containing protein [Erysipelotrichia bacterium]
MSVSLVACGSGNSSTKPSGNNGSSVSNIVTVSFDYNGGIIGENDPLYIELEIGQTVTELPEPTKEACIFQGWWRGDVQLTTSLPITEDIKFLAKWEEEPPVEYDGYLIFFNLDAHVDVTVYQEKTCLTPEEDAPFYQTRNSENDEMSKDDANIYFSIAFDAGYELDLIKFEQSDGAWPGELMKPDETFSVTNKENCYRVTRITANGTIIVSSKVKA